MDRLFLDANILFSASYRPESSLLLLWSLEKVELLTSTHAIEEAYRNLRKYDPQHISYLDELIKNVTIVIDDVIPKEDPDFALLPDKDQPILAAAIAAGATHLLTGDRRHFGQWYGMRIKGILIQPPGDYLKNL